MDRTCRFLSVFIILCATGLISGHALGDLAGQMQVGDWSELSTTGLTSVFLETTGGDP